MKYFERKGIGFLQLLHFCQKGLGASVTARIMILVRFGFK
jgi:hypothetical protein